MGVTSAFVARIREIYRDDLVADAGILHVASVWSAPDGSWRSLRIGSGAPRSATDAFVLAVARARADAIVTTGAILRAEPGLCHRLRPEASAWRTERLGKHEPPPTVVLTGRSDLDLDHPLLLEATAPVVLATGAAEANALRARAAARGRRIDAVGLESTELRDVLRWLARERGYRTVLVEAGVSSTRALYDAPIVVDELMLSVCCASAVDADAIGGVFLGRDDPLRARLDDRLALEREHVSREESGEWRFRRHRLRALTPAG